MVRHFCLSRPAYKNATSRPTPINMARLLSIVFTALLASLVIAEDHLSCGSSNYFPSQVRRGMDSYTQSKHVNSTPALTTASSAQSSTATYIFDAAMRATPPACIGIDPCCIECMHAALTFFFTAVQTPPSSPSPTTGPKSSRIAATRASTRRR
jgi:hypothetical protein